MVLRPAYSWQSEVIHDEIVAPVRGVLVNLVRILPDYSGIHPGEGVHIVVDHSLKLFYLLVDKHLRFIRIGLADQLSEGLSSINFRGPALLMPDQVSELVQT